MAQGGGGDPHKIDEDAHEKSWKESQGYPILLLWAWFKFIFIPEKYQF